MRHRWILLPDEGLPDVAPNPVFLEFASNGVISMRKIRLITPFRAQGRCLTQIRHVRDETASSSGLPSGFL